MSQYLFAPSPIPAVEVFGMSTRFPVHRVYCIGRNYADHVREMGNEPAREQPIFFLKPADSVITNGTRVAYPSVTSNFHHEVELVVALHSGGADISAEEAPQHIFGYAVGNDFTRRDLQLNARNRGQPWELGKSVDHATAVGAIHAVREVGHLERGRISLSVDGNLRQQGDLADMIWKVPSIIAEISRYYALCAGDLIFTGTPAGVAALSPGQQVVASIEGLSDLQNEIGTRKSDD